MMFDMRNTARLDAFEAGEIAGIEFPWRDPVGAETRLYVTGTPREHESHFDDFDDRDPLARLGRTLEESAVEELAVDQWPLPSGPRHDARPEIERSEFTPEEQMRRRLLEQKRRALSKTRTATQRRLETAERKLAQCGAFRRRGRDELRAQIELERRALAQVNQQLGEADALLEKTRLKSRAQDRITHRRPRHHDLLAVRRDPPARTLER
jgi:hypothetical protein